MCTPEANRIHRVFVYGTLKRGQPNFHHFENNIHGKVKFVAAARTEVAYPLVIATKWNLPFLLYSPGNGEVVHGEIYDVDDSVFCFMDEFEGHPEVYQRDKIQVLPRGPGSSAMDHGSPDRSGGEQSCSPRMECWAYFLKDFPQQMLSKCVPMTSYEAFGSHGLHYSESDDLSGPENISAALQSYTQDIS